MTDRKRLIERLFRQHYRDMYRLACILLHDEQESMDIVHDVNVMRDRQIHDRARQHLMLESEVSVREAVDIEAEISALQQGVADLMPPVCRKIIMLHYRDGLTFREIAKRLGVSETTVYKHLHSALDQLRLTLKNTQR